MHSIGKAKKVTVYIGESDRWGRKSLHLAILELLKKEQCAGATVVRALAGFGAHSRIKTASLVSLSSDLPLQVIWVDNPARVERVLPHLREMVTEGLITVEDVDVVFYSHRGLRHLSAFVPVQDVMSRDVRVITVATPLAEAARRLLGEVQKSLVVVDDNQRVVGIITDGDILKKAGIHAAGAVHQLTQSELENSLQALSRQGQVVGDVMTPKPLTVTPDTTIPLAVEMMLDQDIKRLPVVNTQNQPVGVVSRVDILRAFAEPLTVEKPRQSPGPGELDTVAEVMTRNVPAVPTNASLAEIVSRLVSHVRRRVVVVDAEERVVGIITDGDLIKQATSTERSGLIQLLARQLPLEQADNVSLQQRTAAEVMTRPVITVSPDTPLTEALTLLLSHQIKRLPVIDGSGRLIGLVGRGAILQALGRETPSE